MGKNMDTRALKIGWGLLALWVVITLIIANGYRSLDNANTQIHKLSSSIQEIRHSFSFDAPYRVHMSDSQSLNLQRMHALRLQLGKYQSNRWLWPDISQLLFYTDRFIEQSQIYLNNNLELLSLVEQIAAIRERYKNQPTEELYFHLSTDVLEVVFGDSALRPQANRDLNELFIQSNQLEAKQRQDLRQVLAQVSAVLSNYAQGRFIVGELESHAVVDQIDVVNDEFRQVLFYHLVFAMLFTLIVLMSFIVLLRLGQASKQTLESEEAELEPDDDNSAQAESKPEPKSEQKQTSKQNTAAKIESKSQPKRDFKPKAGEHKVNQPKIDELKADESKADEPKALASQVVASTETNQTSSKALQREIEFDQMLESFNHDIDSVCMLLEVFIADHTADVETIIQLLETSAEEAQRKAHSLKGVGGNLSALQLSQAASKVEVAIKTSGSADPHCLSELKQHLDGAIKEAKAFLQQHNR